MIPSFKLPPQGPEVSALAYWRLAEDLAGRIEQSAFAWAAMLPSRPQIVVSTHQPACIRDAAAIVRVPLERKHWSALREAAQGRNIP